MEENCYNCVYRSRAGSNTRHSRCDHPVIDKLMSDHDALVLVMDGLVNKHKIPSGLWGLEVEVKSSAIANRWGLWPFNFDPIWVKECNGFKAMGDGMNDDYQKCGMELTRIFSQMGMDVGLSSALTGFAGFSVNVFQTAKQTDPRLLELLVIALNDFLKSEGIEFVVMSAED